MHSFALIAASLFLAFVPQLATGQSEAFQIPKGATGEQIVAIANAASAKGIKSKKIQLQFAKLLTSESIDVRVACVDAIPYLGTPTIEVIELMFESVKTPGVTRDSRKYGQIAAAAIAQIGKPVVPIVVKKLDSDSSPIFIVSTEVVHLLGDKAAAAVPVLIRKLEPGPSQWPAAYALVGMGPKAKAAIPALTKMLDAKNFNLFCMAARALGGIGAEAISVKDKLMAKAKTGNSSERGRALEALGAIGAIEDAEVAELFKGAISAEYLNVRDLAMIGVGLSKEKAKAFIPLVEDAITNKKFNTKPEAAYTLAMIGGSMETAVKALVKSMGNPTYELSSLEKLKALGGEAKPALPAITELLDSDDDYLRAIVIEVISEIGPTEKHLKRFQEMTKNSEFRTARAARIALAKK